MLATNTHEYTRIENKRLIRVHLCPRRRAFPHSWPNPLSRTDHDAGNNFSIACSGSKVPLPRICSWAPNNTSATTSRRALIEAALPGEDRESGFTRHELEQTTLAAALDDARSLSLFASKRVIWIAGAEAALPRGRRIASEAADDTGDAGGSDSRDSDSDGMAAYLREPTPGTVLVIEASRYDFDGEDKPWA